jgi:hypothetical protein
MGQYAARPPARREERAKATQSFDVAQDRELVERLVEWQMMPCWWIRAIFLALTDIAR